MVLPNNSADKVLEYIRRRLEDQPQQITSRLIQQLKLEAARKFGLTRIPKDYEIISYLRKHAPNLKFVSSKPTRSLSGIVVVSVFTRPGPCPGQCIYCPGGIDKPIPSPKSYSGHEPAARRAAEFNFDPYLQIRHRLKQLERLGHPTDKVSLIVMGGTFLFLPREYRDSFMRGVYEGLLGRRYPRSYSLEDLQRLLESSHHRLVELTFETRPDYAFEEHIDEMLRYGATRVEIGVQTLSNDKLIYVKRGHDVDDIRKAFQLAKDAGFKIVAHIMPNLPPNPDPEEDFYDFIKLMEDPDFRPDMIKIYPTAVVKGTVLYDLWVKGHYKPYDEETLVEVLALMKKAIPPWVRIQRLQRDIPTYIVDAGYSSGNLRQVVKEFMNSHGWRCRCIRCREVGHKMLKSGYTPDETKIRLISRKYVASGGEEIFLAFEDITNDVIFGMLRLRYPSPLASRPEITSKTMIIRELHVYGRLVPLGARYTEGIQHRGLGSKLLEAAENIAVNEYDAEKIVIISGIGVREYYRRFGYRLEGAYMSKKLKNDV